MAKNKFTPGPWAIHRWHANPDQNGVLYQGMENGIKHYECKNDSLIQIAAGTQHLKTSNIFGSFEGCHVAQLSIPYGDDGLAETVANARLIAAAPDLLDALEYALQYLESPEVQGIPFAAPARSAVDRAKGAIKKALGES